MINDFLSYLLTSEMGLCQFIKHHHYRTFMPNMENISQFQITFYLN